jgi:predicted ATP-grasp superfamily ATP-dependent carboligase
MNKKAFAIFSGYNQRAVIAFLRVLTKYKIPYGIIAKSESDTILLTQYKSNVYYIRKEKALNNDDLFTGLKTIRQKLNTDILYIAPSTEALNRYILDNRQYFTKSNFIIPLVEKDLYNEISDKLSFSILCKENGLKIPDEYSDPDKLSFPFAAKPKKYFSSDNTKKTLSPLIIDTREKLQLFYNNFITDDFYYQEFIHGPSKYLLYYFHNDGTVYKSSQENLIQQPDGKSMIAAISSDLHTKKISESFELLFKQIKFSGFVMIEIKGDNYMIEANPRFWGPSQLLIDSGSSLFEAFLHDLSFIFNKPTNYSHNSTDSLYFWHGGLLSTLTEDSKPVFHNFSETNFIKLFPKFLKHDVYRRYDTIEIFKNELNL